MKEVEMLTGLSVAEARDIIHTMIVESAMMVEERNTMIKRVTLLNALYDLVGED